MATKMLREFNPCGLKGLAACFMLCALSAGQGKPAGGVTERENRMNPLESIQGTLIAGLVLAVVLVFVIKALAGV